MWHSLMHGQCLNAMWHSLGGQCLDVTWFNLGGHCLNATWHLPNQKIFNYCIDRSKILIKSTSQND
jgi:hypothetical protein